MRPSPLLILCALCACHPDGPGWRTGGLEDTASEPVVPGPDDDDLVVTEQHDEAASWSCADDPESCDEDYFDFADLAEAWAQPISQASLEAQLDAIEAGEVEVCSDGVSESELPGRIRGALNMSFLLDGLDARELDVTVIAELDEVGYTERHLLLDDPWVGSFFAIMLLPDGAADQPVPGVAALHGHGQQAGSIYESMYGESYPGHGYAVISTTFRVMGGDASEDEMTRALLLQGFSLEALRIYESLLALKYLRWHPGVDAERLGVVGHSGSSIAWNLAIRLDHPAQALVSDLTGSYYDIWDGYVLDDTLPELYPYHPAINDLQAASTPVLEVSYSYVDEFDEIVEFLNEQL